VKVSLQAILESIRASGASQVVEIDQNAYTQAHQILLNARLAAQQEREEACLSAVAPAYRERSRIIHRARLEALRVTGNVREDLVDTVLDQVRGRLQGIRRESTYPIVLRRLIQTALNELKGSLEESGKAQLSADPQDRALLTIILQDMRLDIPVSYDLRCWGGLVAKSEDSRVVVINTIEARLERAIPYLRRTLSAFFENGQTELNSEQVREIVRIP
jgi:vacuolar-type H+-ATPase subunit E/Vma4